jgi:O-antigen/teichoic acid export membrane protein
VTEYGYWQLYFLYVSYTGVLQLGWCDGVYLRYGGKIYEKLDKGLVSSQFWYISIFYVSFISLLLIPLYYFKDYLNMNLIFFSLISGLITTPRGILYYILQATNNIKKYSKIIMLDRGVFGVSIIIFLMFGINSYYFVIISDLFGKLCAFGLAIYYCRDIVSARITAFRISLIEAFRNLNAGYKLMFANISSQLIVGIVRFNIEGYWGIEIFGNISLTLSISSLFMLFINAVAIIIFPMLRRTSEKHLSSLYLSLRTLLMVPILFMLIFYYPMQKIISFWLPQYAEGLSYMALLFPIVVYESKMSLIVNTYLKSLRKEKVMLIINLVTVILSFFSSYITVYILNNIELSIICIVFLLMFRCILAEIYISKILKISVIKNILYELLLSVIFIITAWFISGWLGLILYLIVYLTYLLLMKKDILTTLKTLKKFIT